MRCSRLSRQDRPVVLWHATTSLGVTFALGHVSCLLDFGLSGVGDSRDVDGDTKIAHRLSRLLLRSSRHEPMTISRDLKRILRVMTGQMGTTTVSCHSNRALP